MATTATRDRPHGERIYLSRLLGAPVRDAQGARIGRIADLVVRFGAAPHPPVAGIVATAARRRFFIPWAQVAEIGPDGARLSGFRIDIQPFARRTDEALLRRDVLDKQLIDVDGRRVIRANDLCLAPADGALLLVGVDVSARGLWRRLGPAAATKDVESSALIDWADIESFATDIPMVRLRAPHERLARLHPVEIARIVESVSRRQGQEILESLDADVAADTVQELATAEAIDLIDRLEPSVAADILDEMEPDDAADVLADLPEERAERLLEHMEPDEAADVRDLLEYEGDTAGGLMTTQCVRLAPATRAGEALAAIRALEEPPNPLYHVYLVEEGERLAGAASLRDVVLADPAAPLAAIADLDYPSIHADDPPRQVAHTMASYNLSDLPVVDGEGRLLGIVLVDDAMDVLYPDLWRRRLSDVFR